MTDTVRVMCVDDHPFFREVLQSQLSLIPDVEVIGSVGTGQAAIDLAAELQPDVVLMDLNLKDEINGIEATREIVARSPATRVIVLTMTDEPDSLVAAIRAGARGYLLKGAGKDEVARALRDVADDGAIFGAGIAERAISFLAGVQERKILPELTDREREVLVKVSLGWNNPRIARHLGLSEKTVRNNVSSILAKLGVSDRGEAGAIARDLGLGL